MSKYTFKLRDVITFTSPEYVHDIFSAYDLSDYLTQNQIDVINDAGIFDKDKLANKIINYYYMREIGLETIGLFKFKAVNKMDLLMEKYGQLIYTNSLDYDLLVNEDYTETFEREASGTTTGEASSNTTNNSNGLNILSNTPQGNINKTDILEGKYASQTNAGESENEVNVTDESSSNAENQESYTRHVKGNRGISATYQALIKQYRDNIITIYNDIIADLNDLFMGIF